MDDKPEADVAEQFQPVDDNEVDDGPVGVGEQWAVPDADPADLADQQREVPPEDPDDHA